MPIRDTLDGYWASKRLVVVRPPRACSDLAVVRDHQGVVHRVNARWLERCWQRTDQPAAPGGERAGTQEPGSVLPCSSRRCGRAVTQRGRDLAVVACLAGFLVALGLLGWGTTSRSPVLWGLALGLFLFLPFLGPWVEERVVRRARHRTPSPATADQARDPSAAGPDNPAGTAASSRREDPGGS